MTNWRKSAAWHCYALCKEAGNRSGALRHIKQFRAARSCNHVKSIFDYQVNKAW